MLAKEDKLIVTVDVASFLKKGDIVKIVDVEGDIISFAFGEDFMHKGIMNHAECEAHFTKYVEPKAVAPTVTEEKVDWILENSDIYVETVFDKCTVVTCMLPNGFVIVESSACVSPENYDEEMGVEICLNKIKDKVWELEGYKLQSELFEEKCGNCDECPCGNNCDGEDEEDECLYTDLDCDDCEHYEECWY